MLSCLDKTQTPPVACLSKVLWTRSHDDGSGKKRPDSYWSPKN